MEFQTVLTTFLGVASALAPAIVFITGYFKRLRDSLKKLESENTIALEKIISSQTQLQMELRSTTELINQKVSSEVEQIRVQISALRDSLRDQQEIVLRLQESHTRLSERVAVLEANHIHLSKDVEGVQG